MVQWQDASFALTKRQSDSAWVHNNIMTQIIVIHGGRTFENYGQYISSLKQRAVDAGAFKTQKSWRDSLQEFLGRDFEVFNPRMPNPNNAVYEEWKIWFERAAGFLDSEVILIGHSLGSIFLAKYLSENMFAKKIKAVFLVAAPCDAVCPGEFLTSFTLPQLLKMFSDQVPKIYLLHSKDDPIVPFSETGKYKAALPNATVVTFEANQHFNQEFFPELVELIKKL